MTQVEQSEHALSKELTDFVESLNGEDSTMGALVDTVGDRGFGLLLLILALPAALPIPAPGYATPFGLMMIGLGWQLAMGRETPWFPENVRKRTLSFKGISFSVRNGKWPLKAVEVLVRPRLSGLARNRTFLRLVAVTIMLMAASMSIPLPLTNTAPSFVIFILAAGILEEDGLLLIFGMLLAPIAIGIAGLALYTAITLGPEAVEETVKPMVKGWLGLS
ncbi:MAG: exopolysaccharide biosynthesis protein [Proteobacteria bacterium]|nr:exopolysaccharide biosynthesis protein [Pseudomonadota bacterium]MCP4919118.1 exopolysaccharide biosynthesis protein [Pseudomonadota bacterium]